VDQQGVVAVPLAPTVFGVARAGIPAEKPLALTCSTWHISVIGQRPSIEKIQAYLAARPAQSTPRLS